MKKICTKCFLEKPELEYAIKHKERNKRSNICKKCHKEYSAKHYLDNREKQLNNHKSRKQLLRQKVLELYGCECINCGCKEISILELNHVNGDGNIERKQKGMYTESIYKEALKNDGRYDLRCKICNIQHYVDKVLGIKGFEIIYTSVVK